MENPISRYLPDLLYVFYILFLASVICSWNAISSISIGCILLLALFVNKREQRSFFTKESFTFFSLGCLLLFILQFVALLYTENQSEGYKHIQLKSALVFVPYGVYFSRSIYPVFFPKFMRWFIGILAVVTVFCFTHSLMLYLKTQDNSVFFYHALVQSIEHHAIQFSILVFIALIFLLQQAKNKEYFFHPIFHFALLVYFMSFLVLLSSKLVIAFFLAYLIYFLFLSLKKFTGNRFVVPISVLALTIIASILVFTRNPVTNRFQEIIAGKIQVVAEDKFNPGIYFNGLQFRLLQWKFVVQILNENSAWLEGLGPGDVQQVLDRKYIDANMYVGTASRGDRGFLGYNTHNQFLESLLQNGILGLVAFLVVCIGMVKMMLTVKKKELSAVIILLLAYALNESVFETQYGAMIFLFFPLFIYQGLAKYH